MGRPTVRAGTGVPAADSVALAGGWSGLEQSSLWMTDQRAGGVARPDHLL